MRHGVAGRQLGRPTGHRMMLSRNLVTDVLRHERIQTTEAKAKEIRPMVERMITLGKDGSLHARRQAIAFLTDTTIAHKLFEETAGRYRERPGGYTRILKLGRRKGDGAPMAQIELV